MINSLDPTSEQSHNLQNNPTSTIAVIKEQLYIEKQWVETGKVKISKKVIKEVYDETFLVLNEEVVIERKAIGEYIEGEAPVIHFEGDITVIPVLKEVVVKRLLLVEELHVTKRTTQRSVPIHEVLRKEEINIQRTDSPAPEADQHNP